MRFESSAFRHFSVKKLMLVLMLVPMLIWGSSVSNLWVGKYPSFSQGACDDQRGWFALRSWTAECDFTLEANEGGTYVFEYSTNLIHWHELNNNPDIAFPPYASFNGVLSFAPTNETRTFTFVFPSPPLDIMFLRLKQLTNSAALSTNL